MACFLVPAGEAIVMTVVQKVVEHKEKSGGEGEQTAAPSRKWSQRLRWLNTMLWGGCLLLALEHIWHGEVVPWPPFLTAMENPADVSPMLHEMATYGVTMAIVVTVVWAVVVWIADARAKAERRSEPELTSLGEGV